MRRLKTAAKISVEPSAINWNWVESGMLACNYLLQQIISVSKAKYLQLLGAANSRLFQSSFHILNKSRPNRLCV